MVENGVKQTSIHVDNSILIFLKFMGSVIPTIEFDFVSDLVLEWLLEIKYKLQMEKIINNNTLILYKFIFHDILMIFNYFNNLSQNENYIYLYKFYIKLIFMIIP